MVFKESSALCASALSALNQTTMTPVTPNTLHNLDRHFTALLPWLAALYDHDAGGFFDSAATRDSGLCGPDIQSTAQVLGILDRSHLLPRLPVAMRAHLVRFFQSRQHADSGLFIDPDFPQMRDDGRLLGRALNFATAALCKLGAEPLHPLPTGDVSLPDYLRSPHAFREHLEQQLGPEPGYGTGTGSIDHHLNGPSKLLESLPPDRRDAMVRVGYEYMLERQHADTGLWAGELDGAFKAVMFFKRFDLPVPRADAMYRSCIDWFRPDPQIHNTCRLGNPFRVIVDILPHTSLDAMPPDDLRLAVDWADRTIPRFSQADGGLSRFTADFKMRPNDLQLGDASGPQSDVNGTAMVMHARDSAFELAGLHVPPLPNADAFVRGVGG